MEGINKIKTWIAENAPMLQGLYQNKYVGMLYDRFASLPARKQKQALLTVLGGGIGAIVLFIGIAYLSLWSLSGKSKDYYSMVSLLLQYQKETRDKAPQLEALEQNNRLGAPGAFKQALADVARSAGISPKMAVIDEKGGSSPESEDQKGTHEVQMREASVSLQRVNLAQLKSFLQGVEFGSYNLIVSSLKTTNDEKIRGYMKADISIVAYLFQSDENL